MGRAEAMQQYSVAAQLSPPMLFVVCVLCCPVLTCPALFVSFLQMLGISLLTFRHPKHTASKLIRAASGALTPPKQGWLGANMPVLLMYLPVHVFFTLWVLSFAFMPQKVALSLWAAFLVPYYVLTHKGNPAHTGGCDMAVPSLPGGLLAPGRGQHQAMTVPVPPSPQALKTHSAKLWPCPGAKAKTKVVRVVCALV